MLMSSFKEPLKNWFGYSRRERRATFILLIMLLAIGGLRFALPEKEITIEEIPPGTLESSIDFIPDKQANPVIQKQKVSRVIQRTRTLIDLNTCDSISLEALPGIGPVLSARIIKYRKLLSGYASVGQLKEVYGLPEETFNLISGRVIADSLAVRKININNSDFKGLIRMPYFERFEVVAILKYLELNGRLNSINDMIDNKLITSDKAVKLKPYLEFGE